MCNASKRECECRYGTCVFDTGTLVLRSDLEALIHAPVEQVAVPPAATCLNRSSSSDAALAMSQRLGEFISEFAGCFCAGSEQLLTFVVKHGGSKNRSFYQLIYHPRS